MYKYTKYIIPTIIAVLYSALLILSDMNLFSEAKIFEENIGKYLTYKIIGTIILIFIFNLVYWCYQQIKLGNKDLIQYLKFSFYYFIVLAILLFIFWPGSWSWDEVWVLVSVLGNFQLDTWQHIMTSWFYIMSLMLLPFKLGSIIIFQILLSSLVVGYVVYVTSKIITKKYYLLIWLPFILPPVFSFVLLPLRFYLVTFGLLFVFFNLIHRKCLNKPLNWKNIILFSSILAIIINWRLELIILIIFIIPLMFFSIRKLISYEQIFILISLFLIVFSTINFMQNKKMGKQAKFEYQLLAVFNPLSNLLQEDENIKISNKDLEGLNKVLDIEILKKYPSYKEVPAYWFAKNELLRKQPSSSDKREFYIAYINIILQNPKEFFKYRYKTFKFTTVTGIAITTIPPSVHNKLSRLYSINVPTNIQVWIKDNILFIFLNVYSWLCIFMSLLMLIWSIIKRDKFFVTCSLFVIVYIIGIFVTVPAVLFYYYYPVFLLSITLFIFYLLLNIYNHGLQKIMPTMKTVNDKSRDNKRGIN